MIRKLLLLVLILLAAPAAQAANCGIAQPGTTQRVDVANTGRAMLLHFPKDMRPGARVPLLYVLHGSGGNGAAILKRSALADTADRHGFIVAAPDGGIPVKDGFVWNIPGVPTITGKVPGPGDADDVAFVKAAVDWLVAERCVDRTRVYSTGISGGGRMTSWLACVAADRFAAIAPVVGLRAGNPLDADKTQPDPATCKPSRPMPIIAFAGDKDTTNPIEGGGSPYWQYPMAAAERRWAALNHCSFKRARRTVAASVYEERYTGCRARAEVVGRITIGGTHDWVADNEAMWTFLSRHRR